MASKQLTFSMKDLPCEKVVVFKDRAEVKRSVKTNLKKGENEIVINGVTNSIDRDSVRVEGHGQATVLDVVCQSKHVEIEKASGDNDRIKELRAELDRLESQQESNRYKLDKLNRQIAVLNEFANTLSKPAPAGNNQNSSGPLINSKESVDNFLNFIDSYSEKFDALSEKKHALEKEIKKLDEQIRVTRENLDRLQYSNYTENIEIVILLESAKDDNEVNLHVSYLVYSASWTPKYDIRVFNKEKEKSMTINYYGMIVQSTGEDWIDTKISLSTAVPSVGGNVPELETVNVKIREPVHYEPRAKGGFGGGMMMARMKNESVMMADYAPPMAMACVAAPAPPIQHQVAQVQTSTIGSTSTYDIPRSATIPSDNNTHKVSIGIIELKPEFEYESVPKKSLHAYIKAKVINTSEYALLAGPASVFLDNNFVAKTELKAYSPLEEFHCSLGVDPAIKVEYKPIKKYKAQSGLISKTTTTTYHQIIELKNTSQTSAKVLLVDNLPLSNDDKIQVKLLEPVIKKDSTSIRINKQNNLEFDLNIPSGKTEEISIKYSIDHPSDKEIDLF